MCSLLASVPCGMATPSPMYVEIDCSRSRIASAYAGVGRADLDQHRTTLTQGVLLAGGR